MKILVTGPQGSGKTTQAKLLAEYLDIPFIGMGGVLRERMERDDEIGNKIREAMDKGILVDDEIVANFTKQKVLEDEKGYIMDGYPRSIHQLKLFNPDFDKVFYLDISDEEVMSRLLKRGRADDTPLLIKERLAIYHEDTESLLSIYKEKGILVVIDGSLPIEQIKERMREALNG